MEFERTNENCIIALLTDEDMDMLGLDYDELDYSDEQTRKALRRVLSLGKSVTNYEREFETKLRIDVMPGLPDGCMILFTDLTDDEQTSKTDETMIFESASFDALADCALALSALNALPVKSELWGKDKVYRLVVSGIDCRLAALISEYLLPLEKSEFTLERTKEYMDCLIEKDALKILCGKASER